MISDREWASFDRMVGVIERAYILRARRRAELLLERWHSDDREEFLVELVDSLRTSRAFVDDAWRLALALQQPERRGRSAVVDLRETAVPTSG